MKNKSLVNLAQEAGLAQAVSGLIMSKVYKIVYFSPECSKSGPPAQVLGIVDPKDYDSCALYNLPRDKIYKSVTNERNIDLDKEIPAHIGVFVPGILDAYAENKRMNETVAIARSA